MKTLLLLRHAKSSWKNPDLADHERPLKKRGKRDAPNMGKFLAKNDLLPDLIVTSTAVRARETARLLADAAAYPGNIHEDETLYPTEVRRCITTIQGLSDEYSRVMLVGHNPGLEDFLGNVAGRYERFPTCAVARLDADIEQWRDFLLNDAVELTAIYRPRDLFEK